MSSTKCLDLMIKVATHLESVNKSSDTKQPQFIGLIYTVFHYMVSTTKSKQGDEQTRSFEPTNEKADCWPATHSYNFIIRVK